MKARIKSTGKIIDVAYTYKTVGKNPTTKCETLKGERYNEDDLDFNIEDDNTPDYWTKLKHQYAGMAMQGILGENTIIKYSIDEVCNMSVSIATALVEKMKEEKK